MIESKLELYLENFKQKNNFVEIDDNYRKLYSDFDEWDFKIILPYFHFNFDKYFEFMNSKFKNNKHYNAYESRMLLGLIKDYIKLKNHIREENIELILDNYYEKNIEYVKKFLKESNGSEIPEDYKEFELKEFEPIFYVSGIDIKIKRNDFDLVKPSVIGEGSYAIVYKYKDDFYNTFFAVKKLKSNVSEKEKDRFKKEYEILNKLDFPYIVKVYKYYEEEYKYIMDYCDRDLEKYILENNTKLNSDIRKRMVSHFLYSINYLHSKNILHRDISYKNILIKLYDNNIPIIKLSDFGLLKDEKSNITSSDSDMKGAIRDPSLDSFKNYTKVNDIHNIGYIINFIITGKQNINTKSKVYHIVQKCTEQKIEDRYQNVMEIIKDFEKIDFN